MDATKTCTKCGEYKPLGQFYKGQGCRDGRRGNCKACASKADRRNKLLRRTQNCGAEPPEGTTKVCTDCGEEKSLGGFNRDVNGVHGRSQYCRECVRRRRGKFLARHSKRINEEKRAAYKTSEAQARRELPEVRRKKATVTRNYKARHPERPAAHNAVNNAIRACRLIRQPCETCDTTEKVQAHHDDYSKSLDVRWLCFRHHREVHGQTVIE